MIIPIIFTIFLIALIIVNAFCYEYLYMEKGKLKWFWHDICHICRPSYENSIDYDSYSNIATLECEYCHKKILFKNVCPYIRYHKKFLIREVSLGRYCNNIECIKRKKNMKMIQQSCCPLECDSDSRCLKCPRLEKLLNDSDELT